LRFWLSEYHFAKQKHDQPRHSERNVYPPPNLVYCPSHIPLRMWLAHNLSVGINKYLLGDIRYDEDDTGPDEAGT